MDGVLERAKGVSLDELKKKMAEFAKERDWDQFHSPRNLLLALVCMLLSYPCFFFYIFLCVSYFLFVCVHFVFIIISFMKIPPMKR